MTDVTVDLEDLERIVFAASAVKKIEGALAAWKRDPFIQPHLDFSVAQTRLETALLHAKRSASRADRVVDFDAPLDKEEINAMEYVVAACDGHGKSPGLQLFVISPEDKGELGRPMSVYDRLAAKGCLEVGQFVQGVVWAGADTPRGVEMSKMNRRGLLRLIAALPISPFVPALTRDIGSDTIVDPGHSHGLDPDALRRWNLWKKSR